jgi:farnesyl diphosphate synthase/geranylgeranyl diphosphate synthase type II
MIRILAYASGTSGMAGGQAIDLASVGHALTAEGVENMHRRKTGALIQCSVLLGATAAGLTEGPKLEALRKFGADIGLAFQIQDDILDVEGETAVIGKAAGADVARNKPTYPSTFGLQESRMRARALCEGAIAALAPIGPASAPLADLARYMVNRSQ